MEPPAFQWVVRYNDIDHPARVLSFAGFKEDGSPSYAFKFDNIKKFKYYKQAFEVAKQLIVTNKYNASVMRLCAGKGDHFYFTKG